MPTTCLRALFCPPGLGRWFIALAGLVRGGSFRIVFIIVWLILGLWIFFIGIVGRLRFITMELVRLPSFQIVVYPTDLHKKTITFQLRPFHPLDQILPQLHSKLIQILLIPFPTNLNGSITKNNTICSLLLPCNTVHLVPIPFDKIQRIYNYDCVVG